MKELAGHIIDHYEQHAREWDADRNRQVGPWTDGFAVVAHTIEDWNTGSGRTVWLARARNSPAARD
jgi:hypothetical protein